MSELNNITIPSTPNSIPLNGKMVSKPPTPSRLSRLKAHAGQAGAKTEIIIPAKVLEIPNANCLRIMNILKAVITPPRTEIVARETIAYKGRLVKVPLIKERRSDPEKV